MEQTDVNRDDPITVSVLLPSHNSAEFLADAMRSLQHQSLRTFECLIIDDGSVDLTVTIAESFARRDERFKLIYLEAKSGASAARNAGLMQARGRWVALLDADDVYLADRLQVLTGLGEAEQADIVIDDQVVTEYPRMDSSRRAFGFTEEKFDFTQEDFFSGERLFARALGTGYLKPIMRRDFLLRIGASYDESVLSGEDFLFYAQLFAKRPRCIGTSYAGYIYRRRRRSVSRNDDHLHFHAKNGDRILREFGSQLSVRSQEAVAARGRELNQLMNAMPALQAVRRRDWPSLARSLARQPSSAVTCLRLASRRAVRAIDAALRMIRANIADHDGA